MLDSILLDKENRCGEITDDPAIGLNMNVNLRNGGRKAPKGGSEKLQYLLNEDIDISDEMSESFFDDIKYNVDLENWQITPKIYTSSAGIDYLMMFAGGDWQEPVLIFIYWDGKKYRAYVPLKGNRINPFTNMAFGEETNYLISRELRGFPVNADELYKKMEGLSDTPINIPACIEDFEARLQIK